MNIERDSCGSDDPMDLVLSGHGRFRPRAKSDQQSRQEY
jgi:hypothetical protein